VSSQELAADDERAGRDTRSASFPFLEVNAMTGFSKILAMSALLCLVSVRARAQEPVQEATLRIQTRVYNMAKVRPAVLSAALIEASEIFRRIGVEIKWVDGSSRQRLGSSQLYLRIIPRLFPTTRCPFGPSHLGYAATSEEGGVLATIFFHRVEELTRGQDPSFALGYAIAHELGHLLLGYDRRNGSPHSASGLMRGPWQRDDLKRKARETMQFTSEDAGRLRARLLEQSRKSNDLQAPLSLFTEIDTRDHDHV